MEKQWDLKKWLILIFTAIIGYWIINNLSTVGNFFNTVFNIVCPFILGGCLAFVLNIPMTFFEKKILNLGKKKKIKPSKFLRLLSIVFAIIVIIVVLTLIANLIVPELLDVVNLLIDNVPYYVQEATKLVQNYGENLTEASNIIQTENLNVQEIKKQIINQIPTILTSSLSIVGNIISGVTTFIIAIVFAIYILLDKEKLKEQSSRLLYAYCSKSKADNIVNIGIIANNTFKNFFTVQCLEAIILGTLCIIGMLILNVPYAVPIGVLIGVTALIPVVGAFIGIIIGALLIVSIAPMKVVTFIVFVLILQQIEGNLIYPRVVGNSIGLPGMWVLVAVSVGGSIGGVLGMLVGVPIFSIIYILLKKDINVKLNNKKAKIN